MKYIAEDVMKIAGNVVNENTDNFGLTCFEEYDFCSELEDAVEDNEICAGCSKCVIVANDYVVKIPFNGVYDDYGYFYPFDGARGGDGWDYCAVELEKYSQAEDNGFADMFLETEYVGSIGNFPIYVQEKAQVIGCMEEEAMSDDVINTANRLRSKCYYSAPNKEWLCRAIAYYGAVRMEKFIDFLHDYGFSDLHSNNVGIAADGRPVIIDWAGFEDGDHF